MNAFESLALALRGHFEKPFAQLPPTLQQRVVVDFAPWSWEGKTPRQRCHRAKQWDYEHDPAQREVREGVEALTNPDSTAYSLEETQRLRGDYLPEPRIVQPIINLQPLEWNDSSPLIFPLNAFGTPSRATTTTTNGHRSNAPTAAKRNDLLSPLIKRVQTACVDPYDTPSVWAKLRELAVAKTAPFIGAAEDGLQWIDEADQPQYLSIKHLRDRLSRQKKAVDKTR